MVQILRFCNNHPVKLSLAIPPWVCANKYWRWSFGHYQGINRLVLRPSKQESRTAGSYRLKGLAVNRADHPAHVGGIGMRDWV